MKRKKAVEHDSQRTRYADLKRSSRIAAGRSSARCREDPRRPHRGHTSQGERRARRGRELGSRHPGRYRVRADPDEGRDACSEINEALARLEDGKYGYCFECGDEIAEQRLRALPFAVRCKDCEEAREVAEQRERSSQRRGSSSLFYDMSS